MILYLTLISFFGLAISLSVKFIYGVSFLPVLGFTALAIVLVILVDGLTATVCRLLPAKCADHTKKFYKVSAKEKKFYEKLKIRKWKDYIPEIGHFTGFRKNKIVDPKSVEYLDRFLLEICYGELGHFCSIFLGFAILGMFFITPPLVGNSDSRSGDQYLFQPAVAVHFAVQFVQARNFTKKQLTQTSESAIKCALWKIKNGSVSVVGCALFLRARTKNKKNLKICEKKE